MSTMKFEEITPEVSLEELGICFTGRGVWIPKGEYPLSVFHSIIFQSELFGAEAKFNAIEQAITLLVDSGVAAPPELLAGRDELALRVFGRPARHAHEQGGG